MPIPKLSTSPSASITPRSSAVVATTLTPRAEAPSTRRAGHGGHPWSLPLSARQKMQLQPQDGATAHASKLTSIAARLHSSLSQEPEDARLTGGTRSLTRRLLGLNVTAAPRRAPQSTDAPKGLPTNVQVA
jgi:hypothetical protein